VLLWLAAVLALLLARAAWQRWPGLATCAAFWAVALLTILLGWSAAFSQYVSAAGVLSNAAVTLANGGFMPVALGRAAGTRARSLWVQRRSGQRLLFLADNFGTDRFRFSLGDVLLFAGIVLALAGL